MPLIRLIDWRQRHFVEPRPALADLQRACRENRLPAQKICKHWYIQVHSETDLTPVQRRSMTGNARADALVNRVLADA